MAIRYSTKSQPIAVSYLQNQVTVHPLCNRESVFLQVKGIVLHVAKYCVKIHFYRTKCVDSRNPEN